MRRKNTRPVLHYTLSWALNENPTPEEMKEAAANSLKVMGLADHEALIAAHTDKDHLHVHLVVNTVHPETGMTAPMKFSKLELSKWAEGYEMLNGLHCEARVQNNAERRRLATERQQRFDLPARRLPRLDTTLPVDFFLAVDLPSDFARERNPDAAMMAIVREPATPRRWQKGRYGRARAIGCEGTANPPFVVECQHDLGRRFSGGCTHGQVLGAIHTPT